ncbi:MAG: DNA-binding Lrp family transcriptional regulator [Gammaproteobacteria bacterium]|jgi:DNA-binding Lrp family transcriptional regulator
MPNKLDDKDLNLIALLRSNARMPVVNLAKRLGVSRTTVQNRINKLEYDGVILGYTVKLSPDAQSHPVRLFMNISVEAKNEPPVIKKLSGYPEVFAIHHTTGHWDVIADIRAQTLPSLNSIMGEIRLIEGILQTETNLLFDSQL